MKREELRRGTLYAHRTSRSTYSRSRPVLLLDDQTPWQEKDGIYTRSRSPRPSLYGAKAGYLAVGSRRPPEEAASQLASFQFPQLPAAPAPGPLSEILPALPENTYPILVGAQHLRGLWEEVYAEEQREEDERIKANEERDAFWQRLRERSAAHGVSVSAGTFGQQGVVISSDDLLKLLDLADRAA